MIALRAKFFPIGVHASETNIYRAERAGPEDGGREVAALA
jgi:hypothetical protein